MDEPSEADIEEPEEDSENTTLTEETLDEPAEVDIEEPPEEESEDTTLTEEPVEDTTDKPD